METIDHTFNFNAQTGTTSSSQNIGYTIEFHKDVYNVIITKRGTGTLFYIYEKPVSSYGALVFQGNFTGDTITIPVVRRGRYGFRVDNGGSNYTLSYTNYASYFPYNYQDIFTLIGAAGNLGEEGTAQAYNLASIQFSLYKTYTAGEANLKTNYPERIEEPYILIPEISNVFEKDKVGI